MSTAAGIAKMNRKVIFRAGIWKPRTRPGSFEGIGDMGLEWLKEVKETYGFMTATEVANAQHVEACLEAGIDVFWIGARTTVNPFSVQEIADSLNGVDVPVFVKNPIHPDLMLWIGAIERIAGAGIKKLGVIHRGFQYHNNFPYRNLPNWDMTIELRRQFPELPIICDVSHISGDPKLIPQIAQRAMDLSMSGLLIETHVDPTVALSDAKQQVTPAQLIEIIDNLEIREEGTDDPAYRSELAKLRSKINDIDESLIRTLSERMKVVEEIGSHKKTMGITPFQVERWRQIYSQYEEWGKTMGLEQDFITKLGQLIHEQSIDIQERVMNDKTS
jgi:chorismate mutase